MATPQIKLTPEGELPDDLPASFDLVIHERDWKLPELPVRAVSKLLDARGFAMVLYFHSGVTKLHTFTCVQL